jgi:hypothetical protein
VFNGTRRRCLMKKNRVKKSRDTVPLTGMPPMRPNYIFKKMNFPNRSGYVSCFPGRFRNSQTFADFLGRYGQCIAQYSGPWCVFATHAICMAWRYRTGVVEAWCVHASILEVFRVVSHYSGESMSIRLALRLYMLLKKNRNLDHTVYWLLYIVKKVQFYVTTVR